MRGFARASRVVAVIVLTLTWAVCGMVGRSAADAATSQVTILPVCSDSTNNQAQWKVTNTNATAVTVDWSTDTSAATGSWTVPANASGTSFDTPYSNTDTAVKFTQNGVAQVISTSASICNASPQYAECNEFGGVDGLNPTNLIEDWTAKNSLTLSTAGWDPQNSPGGAPLCNDITVTLTSYTLPANYDGNFFPNNTTSVPQTVFDSQTITLSNSHDATPGSDYPYYVAPVAMSVKLPDSCDNIRVSLSYGTANGTVTTAVYDPTNYIAGGLYQATNACVVSTPHVLGASTTVPTLTNTGINVRLTSILATLLIAAAIVVFRHQPKTDQA